MCPTNQVHHFPEHGAESMGAESGGQRAWGQRAWGFHEPAGYVQVLLNSWQPFTQLCPHGEDKSEGQRNIFSGAFKVGLLIELWGMEVGLPKAKGLSVTPDS